MDRTAKNDWPSTMRPGYGGRNRRAVGLDPTGPKWMYCDAHPAVGGPHKSHGLYVGDYHGWTLWMCTHKSKRGNACGAIGLEVGR